MKKRTGSQTNASKAVDDVKLPPDPTTEEVVDEGVEETFPASDPVASAQPDSSASERVRREGETGAPTRPPKRRSPDWLLEKK